jgi:Tol biopolymer transport system component
MARGLLRLVLWAWLICTGLVLVGWIAGRDGHQPALAVVGGLGVGRQDVYLIDLRGPVVNLTKTPANYSGLRWSPDGHWLAYLARREDRVDLYVLDAQTGVSRDLTRGSYPMSLLEVPAWSPDGRWITIAALRQIVAFEPDTGQPRDLVPFYPLGPLLANPAWSPDGTRLAYVEEALDGETRRLILLDPVTGESQTLGDDKRVVGDPAWSPDGAWIVYTSLATGDYELFAYHLGSGEVRNLTRYPGYDAHPTWSPDGRFIAFETDRWGSSGIYTGIYTTTLMPGDLHRLTFSPSRSLAPSWSPDGHWLAYLAGGAATHSYALDMQTGVVRGLDYPTLVHQFPVWWP